MSEDDEQERRARAERLREEAARLAEGRPPASPREFTERSAREAAAEDERSPGEDGP